MKCKKVLAVLLTAAMTMSLAACGGSQETQNEVSTRGREGNHSGRSIGSGDGWPGGCRRCSHINLICGRNMVAL